MKYIHLSISIYVSLLLLITTLSGCSLNYPQYVARSNRYKFNDNQLNNKTYVNSKLVYTYNTQSLEQQYSKIFCSKLSNCASNIKHVKESSDFGNFNLDNHPIANNPYGIDTIDLYRLTYTTPGQLGNTEKVSGGVWIPNINTKKNPQHKIKGIVLYFHPTFFYKLTVPSYAPTQKLYLSLAANLASQGYIVVAPDYIGMGSNWNTMHPYVLYPQINVVDGLSMLTATQHFFTTNNNLNINTINTNNKLPLFVTGYSEGGAYALWFSRLYQEQKKFRDTLNNTTNFKLTGVVPISGAYDLSNVTYKFLISDVNFTNKNIYTASNTILTGLLKPALTANAMLSYAFYDKDRDYLNVFNPDFFNMKCPWQFASNCQFDGKSLNLEQAFNYGITNEMLNMSHNNPSSNQLTTTTSANDMYNSIDAADLQHTLLNIKIAEKVANSARFITASHKTFTNQTNSILPLVNPQILNSTEFNELLLNGNVYYWHSTIPTTFIYLQHDSVVSNLQSQFAYMGLNENKSKNLSYIAVDNNLIHENLFALLPNLEMDHLSAPNYLMLVALNQFNKMLKP